MSNSPAPLPQTPPGSGGLRRRDLLKLTAAAAVGGTLLSSLTDAAPALAASGPRWPGHQPGRIYLGIASQGDPSRSLSRTGPVGLFREYYSWSSGDGELREIQQQHAAGRLPWVSFTPPSDSSGIWSAVAAGHFDDDLRARARRYAQASRPVVVTFSHEPQTKPQLGSPGDWAAAWTRVHDVMHDETGLRNVVSVPIIGEWVFNPINHGDDPAAYLTGAVLSRAAFLGVDCYQNRSGDTYADRLPRVLSFLDDRGHGDLMIGVGETGACDTYGSPSGASWWSQSWGWAAANTDRVGAIAYFDSLASNNSRNDWLLSESPDKLAALRASLDSKISCTLS